MSDDALIDALVLVGDEPELSPLETMRQSCAHVMAAPVQKL